MEEGIRARVGDVFEIELEGASGTGFTWVFQPQSPGPALVELTRENREASSTTPGGRTIHRFSFKALAPGELVLSFRHQRAWQPSHAGTVRSFSVRIVAGE